MPDNKLHTFSINGQIVFAFSTLSAIIALFAVMVFLTIDKLELHVKMLTTQTVPNLTYIDAIRSGAGLLQVSVLSHMLSDDGTEKKLHEQIIYNTARANEELYNRKDKILFSKEGFRLYNAALHLNNTYMQLMQELLRLSYERQHEKARDVNNSKVRPAYDAYQKALDELSRYLQKTTRSREDEAVELIAFINQTCTVLLVIGIAIAICMGFVIISIIRRLKDNNRILQHEITIRKKAEQKNEELILELKKALDNVKQLSGLLPICASCKKIRNDQGYWQKIETYISDRSDAQFTHGICPECSQKLYGKGGR